MAWTPLLAAFSVGMQDSDDLAIANVCLDGMRWVLCLCLLYVCVYVFFCKFC